MRHLLIILALQTAAFIFGVVASSCTVEETNRATPYQLDHRSHHQRAEAARDPALSPLLDAEDSAVHAYYQAELAQDQAAFDKAKRDLAKASEAVAKRLREDGL